MPLLRAAADGIAHGYCLLWDQGLLWLHAGSDALITAAYFLIPFSLVRFIRQRRDLPFNWMFLCFGAFILLCGTTHALGIYNIWVPDWWLSGIVKAATALVSMATAFLLIRLVPQAVLLPSPAQLRAANDELAEANRRLREEAAEREAAQRALARAREDAERLVEVRTAELAEANARLTRSEARYRALVQTSADVIWTADRDGRPAEMSSWEEYTGQPAAVAAGAWEEMIHPEERDRVLTAWRRAVAVREPFTTETRLRRRDGAWRHVQARAVPVREADGAVREWVAVHQDVTERVEAERQLAELGEQLQQAQRMEAVGRLAGGIAHDFNNLLTVITGAGRLVLDDLPPDHPSRREAEDVVAAGTRAAALTAQLLAFSRKQVLQPRVLDLNATMRDMEGLLRRLISENVALRLLPGDGLWPVFADPSQLEQVLLNLALNARDAMPEGGSLTIETANVTLDPEYAGTHLGIAPGEYVMLAVTDTGVGMDEQTRRQAFEPFFTTKERGRGTGLGLSTVYGIVRQSGGHIFLYSEPGEGTTFKIYLPHAQEGAASPPRGEARPAAAGGSETILLVEDADDVRPFVARLLRRAGYAVHEAPTPGEALRLLAAADAPIDLLLTDVIMPGLNGRELADRAVVLRPALPVLFMSGYTDNAIVHHGVLDPGTAYVQKPFSADQLLRAVRQALDAGRGAVGRREREA